MSKMLNNDSFIGFQWGIYTLFVYFGANKVAYEVINHMGWAELAQ